MSKHYKIFPGIGIARVGNSTTEYFIGPEVPGVSPSIKFRDKEARIKRQGARFRVYEFEKDETGKEVPVREVLQDDNTFITWSVHLLNNHRLKSVGWY